MGRTLPFWDTTAHACERARAHVDLASVQVHHHGARAFVVDDIELRASLLGQFSQHQLPA